MKKVNRITAEQTLKIAEPRLPKVLKESVEWEELMDSSDGELEGYSFRTCDCSTISKAHYSVQSCSFVNCSFGGSHFKKSQFCDVKFVNCDLSNVDWPEGSFCRVQFIGCKLMGANFQEGTFTHVSFSENQGRYLVLASGKLNHVEFLNSQFQGAAFDNCRLQSVHFDFCDLTEAEFYHTSLKEIDFRNSDIMNLRVTGPELRKCVVNPRQAMELARLLGVLIRE